MKKSRYSEAKIVAVLKEAENGVTLSELCRSTSNQEDGYTKNAYGIGPNCARSTKVRYPISERLFILNGFEEGKWNVSH